MSYRYFTRHIPVCQHQDGVALCGGSRGAPASILLKKPLVATRAGTEHRLVTGLAGVLGADHGQRRT
jgi:hypothetical protein